IVSAKSDYFHQVPLPGSIDNFATFPYGAKRTCRLNRLTKGLNHPPPPTPRRTLLQPREIGTEQFHQLPTLSMPLCCCTSPSVISGRDLSGETGCRLSSRSKKPRSI